MSFMSNLAANPSGSIYGQINSRSDEDALGLVHKLRNREMQDFKDKANFMSDLSLKQDRLRTLFNNSQQQLQDQSKPMNVVLGQDPNEMTGYQKAQIGQGQQELGIKQQGLGLEQAKINQSGRMGQQALDIKQQQTDLNQQKSDQINATKQAEIERKINDSSQKFAAMQAELERKTQAGEDTLQLHRDIAAAAEERHKLEMEKMRHDMQLKDNQFDELKKRHDALEKERGRSKTTTEVNPDGTKRTTTTERGSAADIVYVKGPDGKTYPIPKDKLDDWNKNHQPQDNQEEEEE